MFHVFLEIDSNFTCSRESNIFFDITAYADFKTARTGYSGLVKYLKRFVQFTELGLIYGVLHPNYEESGSLE